MNEMKKNSILKQQQQAIHKRGSESWERTSQIFPLRIFIRDDFNSLFYTRSHFSCYSNSPRSFSLFLQLDAISNVYRFSCAVLLSDEWKVAYILCWVKLPKSSLAVVQQRLSKGTKKKEVCGKADFNWDSSRSSGPVWALIRFRQHHFSVSSSNSYTLIYTYLNIHTKKRKWCEMFYKFGQFRIASIETEPF